MRFIRSDPGQDLKPSHQGADLGRTPSTLQDSMARRWLSAAKFIVAPLIIMTVAAILLPVLLNARKPSYEMQCMTQLKQISGAVSMYAQDYENYPLSRNWHTALRTYIDDPNDELGRVQPGSKRDPLTCPSDPTDSTVSYLYLNRNMLDWSKAQLSESVIPMVVDEYFHEHTTLAYYDGHTEKLEKQQWIHVRNRQWEIRRDLKHMESFSYEPIPGSVRGPEGVTPSYDRTSVYVWPKF
jgi:type II secretory pathway pseudopilin PulG